MSRSYQYVGPTAVAARVAGHSAGTAIAQSTDVIAFANRVGRPRRGKLFAVTFVVDLKGRLLIADRHSEHVACAGGSDVLSAGEMFFALDDDDDVWVEEVSNQSTGYCPEPESWAAVGAALDRAGLEHPGGFTTACLFRRCEACASRNIVKDGWFHCDLCGASLPEHWNFG